LAGWPALAFCTEGAPEAEQQCAHATAALSCLLSATLGYRATCQLPSAYLLTAQLCSLLIPKICPDPPPVQVQRHATRCRASAYPLLCRRTFDQQQRRPPLWCVAWQACTALSWVPACVGVQPGGAPLGGGSAVQLPLLNQTLLPPPEPCCNCNVLDLPCRRLPHDHGLPAAPVPGLAAGAAGAFCGADCAGDGAGIGE